MKTRGVVALLAVVIALAGCGRKDQPPAASTPPATTPPTGVPAPAPAAPKSQVTVSNITIGNAIGADKKVSSASPTLGRNDTIYASVDTSGSGSATLTARWTYVQGGQSTPVHEETVTISPAGPATSEFHIAKPDGWPAGEYQVEILVDGTPAGTRRFSVS
jgi:hypothetical protein